MNKFDKQELEIIKRKGILSIKFFIIIFAIFGALILLSSCSENLDCGKALEENEKLRQQGWENCNGFPDCVQNIEKRYNEERQKILNKCH